jgi:hypothetical protein
VFLNWEFQFRQSSERFHTILITRPQKHREPSKTSFQNLADWHPQDASAKTRIIQGFRADAHDGMMSRLFFSKSDPGFPFKIPWHLFLDACNHN